jgi:pyrrolidone-carboxylate peptidase
MAAMLRKLRVLMTGFKKIDSVDAKEAYRETNPSGECAQAANKWTGLMAIARDGQINRGEIQGVVYDVTFSGGDGTYAPGFNADTSPGAADMLEADILRIRPDVVISMGYAQVSYFRLEKIAYDEDGNTADNRGFRPTKGRSEFHGDPLSTTLPLDAIERGWRDAGVEFQESKSAGRYVCNDVFYRLMKIANSGRTNGTKILKAGFIHVPDPNLVSQQVVNAAMRIAVEKTLGAIDPADYASLPATTSLLRHG